MSHQYVDYLHSLKLANLKKECQEKSLLFSGTKPVLIGRLLDFQQTGDAKISNKRSVDELKTVVEQNPSKKARNQSIAMKELEKNKSKGYYMQAMAERKNRFQAMNISVLKVEAPQFMLDVDGACLEIAYDSLTMEQFVAENKVLAPKYESACLSDHKYANKEFFTQLSFPSLQVLSLENTKIKDEDLAAALKACPSLKGLALNTQVIGDAFENVHLTNPSLSSITLSQSMDIYKVVPHLSKCPNLTIITGVNWFSVDDNLIEMLVSMPKLASCSVAYKGAYSTDPSKITEKGVAMLHKKGLQLLDFPASALLATIDPNTTMFKATGDLSLDDVKRFLANCPKLRIINFERSKLEDINGALVEISQAPCAATVEIVNVTGFEDIRDDGIKALGKLTSLKTLELAFAWKGQFGDAENISQEVFVEASKNWPELQKLDIQFAPITSQNMLAVLKNCPKLGLLDLTGCGGEMDDFTRMHFEISKMKEKKDLIKYRNPGFKRKGLHITHQPRTST